MTVDDWHKVLGVNLSGAFYSPSRRSPTCSNEARAASSTSRRSSRRPATSARPTTPPPKAGLLGLTKSLAREAALALDKAGKLEDRIGLTVNAVTPGLIETDMTAALPEKALEMIRAAIPLRRMGRPDEVARVVRFLAADSSAYITGQVWGVNGGYDM